MASQSQPSQESLRNLTRKAAAAAAKEEEEGVVVCSVLWVDSSALPDQPLEVS